MLLVDWHWLLIFLYQAELNFQKTALPLMYKHWRGAADSKKKKKITLTMEPHMDSVFARLKFVKYVSYPMSPSELGEPWTKAMLSKGKT